MLALNRNSTVLGFSEPVLCRSPLWALKGFTCGIHIKPGICCVSKNADKEKWTWAFGDTAHVPFCGFVLSCCGLLSKCHCWALLYDLSNVPENRLYKLHGCVLQYFHSDSVSMNLITQIWENTQGFCLHACFFSSVSFYSILQQRSFSVGRKLKNWTLSTRTEKDFSRSNPVRDSS